jgi:hypothetical protein
MNSINRHWINSNLTVSDYLKNPSYRKMYLNERFEQKCKRAVQLQCSVIQEDLTIIHDPSIKKDIERCLKIAASIKDWGEVTDYINKICPNREEIYICLLVTCGFLERYEGLSKRGIEIALQMQSFKELEQLYRDLERNEDLIDLNPDEPNELI